MEVTGAALRSQRQVMVYYHQQDIQRVPLSFSVKLNAFKATTVTGRTPGAMEREPCQSVAIVSSLKRGA